MPKIKTVKSARKRIAKITKTGKVMRLTMASQHLARRKSKRSRKNSLKKISVSFSDAKNIARLILNTRS